MIVRPGAGLTATLSVAFSPTFFTPTGVLVTLGGGAARNAAMKSAAAMPAGGKRYCGLSPTTMSPATGLPYTSSTVVPASAAGSCNGNGSAGR